MRLLFLSAQGVNLEMKTILGPLLSVFLAASDIEVELECERILCATL